MNTTTKALLPGSRRSSSSLLTNHDLLNEVAASEFDQVGPVKGRDDLTPSNQSQAFHSLKVSVFDGHHSGISKQLLWVVVDQLPREEGKKLDQRMC